MLIMAKSVQELIFHRDTDLPPAESRICTEFKEVSSGTISGNRIFGNGYRLNKEGNLTASGEACKTNVTMQTSSREQRDYHHGPSKVNRETRIQCPSNTASTTLSLILAAFANPGIKTFEMLSSQSTFRQGCNRQTFLVDRNLRIFNEKSLILSPIDLCIPTDAFTKGCGSTCQQISTDGSWSQKE